MRFTNVTPTEDQILKNAKKLLGETRVTIAMIGLATFSASNPPPMVPSHLYLYIQLTSYLLKFSLTSLLQLHTGPGVVARKLYPPATPDSEEIESDEEEDDEGELDSIGRLFVALITNETPPEDSTTDNPGFSLPGLDDQPEDLPAQPPSDPKILKRTRAAVAKVTLRFLCTSTPNTTFIFP